MLHINNRSKRKNKFLHSQFIIVKFWCSARLPFKKKKGKFGYEVSLIFFSEKDSLDFVYASKWADIPIFVNGLVWDIYQY